MGVYYDQKAGLWRTQVQRGGRRISTTAATKKQAQAIEARIKHDHFLGRAGRKPDYTLVEAFAKWESDVLPHMKSEIATRNHAAALLDYIGGKLLIEAPDVWDAYRKKNQKKLSPATLNRRGALLRRICNLAYKRWKWLSEPLGQQIELLPEHNARHVYLTPKQVGTLLQHCDSQPARSAILIATYAGLRLSEIMGLTPDSIREGRIHLPPGKSGRPRVIPLHSALAGITLPLDVCPRTVERYFEIARKASKLPHVHFHDLRHTCASWLIAAGADAITVRDILGHADLATTSRYSHLWTDRLDQAIAAVPTAPELHHKKVNSD